MGGATYYHTKEAASIQIPETTSVLAVHCVTEESLGGILLETTDYFTDATWRCTDTFHLNWAQTGYDDSDWATAHVIGYNDGKGVMDRVADVSDDVKWIWTIDYEDGDWGVYCRGYLKPGEMSQEYSDSLR